MLRMPCLPMRPQCVKGALQRAFSSLRPAPTRSLSSQSPFSLSRLRSPALSSSRATRLGVLDAISLVSSARRALSSATDASWLNGTNAAYVDEMYMAWKDDPSSVHRSWDAYFKTGQYTAPPGLHEDYTSSKREPQSRPSSPSPSSSSSSSSSSSGAVDPAKIVQLVRAFQVRGHLMANLDPLGILPPRPEHEDLDISTYGLHDADLEREVNLSQLTADVKGFLDRGRGRVTLRDIVKRLKETYCGTIGYEYMHIPSIEKCNWIREKIETRERMVFTKEAKLQVLDRLTWADHFERFIQKSNHQAHTPAPPHALARCSAASRRSPCRLGHPATVTDPQPSALCSLLFAV